MRMETLPIQTPYEQYEEAMEKAADLASTPSEQFRIARDLLIGKPDAIGILDCNAGRELCGKRL